MRRPAVIRYAPRMLVRPLLFTLITASIACQDTASPRPGDAADLRDAGPPPDSRTDAHPRPDATPRRGPGETCDPGECARGACVHGVCSALCVRDDDCEAPSSRCVGRGGAGRCSVPCERIGDCAPGLLCAAVDEAGGICVAPGPGAADAPCAGREDCASWFCAGDRCLGACDPTTDPTPAPATPCPPDQRCLPLNTQAICTPTGPLPAEAPCDGPTPCATGVCRGGRCADACPDGTCADDRICLRYALIQLCERRCADSTDCGPTGVCQLIGRQRLCVTRGPRAAAEHCETDADCHSGVCALGQCAARCDDAPCPAGTACVHDIAGATCRPIGPAATGARCETASLCASGFCGAGICTLDCADDGPCPPGTRCTTFADGRFCFPTCADDLDCAGPAFCEPRFAEGPTCFWRGPAPTGAACLDHRDCASGRCADGACLAGCVAECPAGQRCVDFGTGTYCAAPPLPLEAACDAGDPCAPGLTCTAGRCLPACPDGCPASALCRGAQCHPRCAADADCRPGRGCDRFAGSCIDPGPTAAGAACTSAADCADQLCLDGRCRAACDPGDDGGDGDPGDPGDPGCPNGDRCLALGDRRWCVPAGPADPGAPCATGAECTTGLCLGRRCASSCDAPCPPDTACRPGPGGPWCTGLCDFDRPCAPDETCARAPGAREGRCVIAPPPTDACATALDCAPPTVACLEAPDGLRCRLPCRLNHAADCPPAHVCAPLPPDPLPNTPTHPHPAGACLPAGPAPPLAPCARAADCASGWCLTDYLDGRCAAPCQTDADCPDAPAPDASRCIDLARDPAAPRLTCAPPCAHDRDCAPPLACRRDIDGRGACY